MPPRPVFRNVNLQRTFASRGVTSRSTSILSMTTEGCSFKGWMLPSDSPDGRLVGKPTGAGQEHQCQRQRNGADHQAL